MNNTFSLGLKKTIILVTARGYPEIHCSGKTRARDRLSAGCLPAAPLLLGQRFTPERILPGKKLFPRGKRRGCRGEHAFADHPTLWWIPPPHSWLGGEPAPQKKGVLPPGLAAELRLILPDPTAIGVALSHGSRTPRRCGEWRTAE